MEAWQIENLQVRPLGWRPREVLQLKFRGTGRILFCLKEVPRWKNQGEEIAYEWWEISTVSGGQMQWNALRQNGDGSTFQQSVKWTKVN